MLQNIRNGLEIISWKHRGWIGIHVNFIWTQCATCSIGTSHEVCLSSLQRRGLEKSWCVCFVKILWDGCGRCGGGGGYSVKSSDALHYHISVNTFCLRTCPCPLNRVYPRFIQTWSDWASGLFFAVHQHNANSLSAKLN